jgi:hypothetical protein
LRRNREGRNPEAPGISLQEARMRPTSLAL